MLLDSTGGGLMDIQDNIYDLLIQLKASFVRDVQSYLPRDTGDLQRSIRTGEHWVSWRKPYAGYVWIGKNRYTGAPLNYQKINPNAGPEWALRCKNDNIYKWKEEMAKNFQLELKNIKFKVNLNF